MRSGQLIEYKVRNSLLQESCRKCGKENSFTPLFTKKALCEVKKSGQQLIFNIFWYFATWTRNKNKLYKTSGCVDPEIFAIFIF